MHQNLFVAIVGAGLGGLCLAQSLKKRGVAFAIYERDSAFNSRTQGYRIRIDHSGQSALKDCLSFEDYTLFEQTSSQSPGITKIMNDQMDESDFWIDSWTKDQDSSVAVDRSVNRQTMREVLYHGVRDHVFFDHHLSHYDIQCDQKVKLHFKNGQTVIADMIVAADGVGSTIVTAGHRLPRAPSSAFCAYGLVRLCDLSAEEKILFATGTQVVTSQNASAIIDAMIFDKVVFRQHPQLSYVEDYIYWAVIGKKSQFGQFESGAYHLSGAQKMQAVQGAISHWNDHLKNLIQKTNSDRISILPVPQARLARNWRNPENRSVTALGDAIHAMSPAGGVGANTALKDAVVLAQSLAKMPKMKWGLSDVIDDYEEQMHQYAQVAIQDSLTAAKKLYGVEFE